MMESEKQVSSSLVIPGSILLAGLLVAGAIFYTKGGAAPSGGQAPDKGTSGAAQQPGNPDSIKPVSTDDHILGNPNAPVKLVEYSDLECPFCKQFQATLQQVVDEYGKSGKVALVYRQFPLAQLHPKAPNEAEASECAADLGGNGKFWAFIDGIFAVTPSNNGLDPAMLPTIAGQIGLNKAAFSACLSSGKYKAKVQAQYNDALAAGGTGTPYSVVVAANGKKSVISGAYPYPAVKAAIDKALAEK